MRRVVFIFLALFLGIATALSQAQDSKPKIILLIVEQNIGGPQRAWWASEIDLSATETTLAKKLMEQGYEIVDPSGAKNILKQDSAFRLVSLSENKSLKLGSLSQADYVLLGKAIASSGSNVPDSTMRSCFANINAKLIRVKDGKIIAYLDATGNSAHMDVVMGGKEALVNAAEDLAQKVITELSKKEGGS